MFVLYSNKKKDVEKWLSEMEHWANENRESKKFRGFALEVGDLAALFRHRFTLALDMGTADSDLPALAHKIAALRTEALVVYIAIDAGKRDPKRAAQFPRKKSVGRVKLEKLIRELKSDHQYTDAQLSTGSKVIKALKDTGKWDSCKFLFGQEDPLRKQIIRENLRRIKDSKE